MAEYLSPQSAERRRIIPSLEPPDQMAEDVVNTTVQALNRNFETPIEGFQYRFELVDPLEVSEIPDPFDYEKIKKTMDAGGVYGALVKGKFRITNTKTGEVVQEKTLNLAKIPTPVHDRTFIVGGKKRSVMHQWRRNPGVFTRRDAKGSLVSEFNLDPATSSNIDRFNIELDRGVEGEAVKFRMVLGTNKSVDMWHVAKLLGATSKDLEKAVGADLAKDVTKDDKDSDYELSLRRLHLKLFKDRDKSKSESLEGIEQELKEQFNSTYLDPDMAKMTLGVSTDRVDKDSVLNSFRRLNEVANGAAADDRESLANKRLMTPADLIAESVGRASTVSKFQRNLKGSLNRVATSKNVEPNIDQLIGTQFKKPIINRVSTSMVQRTLDSTTPLDTIAQATATTILGEGAIKSDQSIPEEAKLLNSGGIGFIDPVHTPESSRAGVVLHRSMKTRTVRVEGKRDKDLPTHVLVSEFLDRKGKKVDLSSSQTRDQYIGAFDQYRMMEGRLVPQTNRLGQVKAFKNGEVHLVDPRDVKVWMQDSGQLFDSNSNLIPMNNSIQGGRIGYSDKQTQQSIALKYREAPLVQVRAPGSERSMEDLLGEEAGAVLAPFAGKVTEIIETPTKRALMVIPEGQTRAREIQVPKDHAMPGGTLFDGELKVKVGDTFKPGDVLADSTFTKDGVLAAGVNLNVAYMPYHSSTFEDAIAMSETASRKLTSLHVHTNEYSQPNVRLSKSLFKKQTKLPLTKDEEDALDENGIIKPGTVVKPGQLIMAGQQLKNLGEGELQRAAAMVGFYGNKNKRGIQVGKMFFEKRWDSPYEGVVTSVTPVKKAGNIIGASVDIRTEEPLEVGDKVFGRYGNKGVVTEIIPDDEMPRDNETGKPLEVLLNPAGVVSRINPNQNFETFLGEVASRLGKTEIVDNWKIKNNWEYVNKRLSETGIQVEKDYLDPRTGRVLKGIGAGQQMILKAKQQVEEKSAARGVGGFSETGEVVKGEDGAQALGELGVYGLLANDAREFLRDAQLYKSEDRQDVWDALKEGKQLPGARIPESYERFKDYLNAAGIRVEHDAKRGVIKLKGPMTDSHVKEIAKFNGKENVITKPWEAVGTKAKRMEDAGKEPEFIASDKPVKGGLFDMEATAGFKGRKWARFELSTPIPNPIYERPIKDMLGVSDKHFEEIMAGTRGVKTEKETLYGSQAIGHMLQQVNLDKLKTDARDSASVEKDPNKRSRAYRLMRTVEMLKENKVEPYEAFMRKQVLVLPASIRGIRRDEKTKDFIVGDINYLYKDLGVIDRTLSAARKEGLPPVAIGKLESGLYDGMRALLQTEGSGSLSGADYQGVLGVLAGRRPDSIAGKDISDVKQSLAKKSLLQRRQVMSLRTVLTPSNDLEMDDVGIPRRSAVAIFEPMLRAEYQKNNRVSGSTVAADKFDRFNDAMKNYKDTGRPDAEVNKYLDRIADGAWVAVKRDPVLHKFGFLGMQVRLTNDKTLKLNPLVYGGLNADNDGDTLAVFAPITTAAKNELRDKMRPSKNLWNYANLQVEPGISHEGILGISRMTKPSKTENSVAEFASLDLAHKAFLANKIEINDFITIGGKKTTLGKAQLSSALPGSMTIEELEEKKIVPTLPSVFGYAKKDVANMLKHIAINQPDEFAKTANTLRKMGQFSATMTGATIRMEDLRPILVKERQQAEEGMFKELSDTRGIKDAREREDKVKSIMGKWVREINAKAKDVFDKSPDNVNAELTLTGARIKPAQLQQVLVAPMALYDTNGKVIDSPVMRSYSEGQDVAGYVSSLHGARMGTVSKVIQVQEPGYLTKQLVNTALDQTITQEDCGTNRSVPVSLTQDADDVEGRVLANQVKIGNKSFAKGTVITAVIRDEMKRMSDSADVTLPARSPLTCRSKAGICQKCAGFLPNGSTYAIGHNFGINAAQSIGERSTQMMLSLFHEGGVYNPDAKAGAKDIYKQASSLLRMPSSMGGNAAVINAEDSKILDVARNRSKGGWDLKMENGKNIFLKNEFRAPDGKTSIPDFYKKGMDIKKGEILTDGIANPKELLEKTGDIGRVQSFLTERLGNLYSGVGVKRRNIESLVRSVTGTVEVTEPAGTPHRPGDKLDLITAEAIKKMNPKFKYRSLLVGVDVAPRALREDWLAKINYNNIRRTLLESASIGAESEIHGTNPIPGLYYGVEFNRYTQGGPPRNDGRY
jgi:DNA-directed RNA polymerase beta subunit/DNA-directed RNA polymerase beta' subunit